MKNSAEPLYLSAAEAAAELSISPATLYAYVSRGLVRSEPAGEGRRARRYRADDVRGLKNRRAPMTAGDGLKSADLPVMDTAVSTITAEGPIYRGVKATTLADTASFEQAATLLWDCKTTDPFATNMPLISRTMRNTMEATRDAPPIDRAIAILSQAGAADPRAYNTTDEGRAATGARIVRLVAAAMLGTEPSSDPLHIQIARAWTPEHKHAEDLIRRALVLLADHELNASTFTLRCAMSTGVSLYDGAIAGLAALKGPRHGGVGPLASRLVDQLLAGDIAAIVREKVALGERFPGFGHMVYAQGDPRADALFSALLKAGIDKRLATEIPDAVKEATGQFANTDYALTVMRRALGMPSGSETTLFAMARTAGWIAHGIEQLQSRTLIRPRARYTGPAPSRR